MVAPLPMASSVAATAAGHWTGVQTPLRQLAVAGIALLEHNSIWQSLLPGTGSISSHPLRQSSVAANALLEPCPVWQSLLPGADLLLVTPLWQAVVALWCFAEHSFIGV